MRSAVTVFFPAGSEKKGKNNLTSHSGIKDNAKAKCTGWLVALLTSKRPFPRVVPRLSLLFARKPSTNSCQLALLVWPTLDHSHRLTRALKSFNSHQRLLSFAQGLILKRCIILESRLNIKSVERWRSNPKVVGSVPTLIRVFLCPCVGPVPSVGLTLTWFIWDRNIALHVTLHPLQLNLFYSLT